MNCLKHHGVQKQRWGIRRFQKEDGGLTPAGREHYRKGTPASAKRFDTSRYQNDDGGLTYIGNQKFDKSEKFDELRKKRKAKNSKGHGISLVTASVSKAMERVGDSSMNNEDVQNMTIAGVNAVSVMFGGLPAV